MTVRKLNATLNVAALRKDQLGRGEGGEQNRMTTKFCISVVEIHSGKLIFLTVI